MTAKEPWKYPLKKYRQHGWLEVSDNPSHKIYWEEYGNPKGEPVIYLHGGPGAGTSPKCSRFFDPKHYRIILFDQRGCGKSKPNASLENNTTRHLIDDINKLRHALKISDKEKAHIFGGSWGSTLALAYAIHNPDKVKSLTLRGIFLARWQDITPFYQGDATDTGNQQLKSIAALLFPDDWNNYVEIVPKKKRGNMIQAYHDLLNSPDEALRLDAAIRWCKWEAATIHRIRNQKVIDQCDDPSSALACANIENHYFLNGSFLSGTDIDQNYILENLDRIKNIPTEIVHGRYDAICPRDQADDLVAAWNKIQPNKKKRPKLHITNDGHHWSEPENILKLTEITDRFRLLGKSATRGLA